MKFRMLLSALLLAAGLVFVAGCDKKAETKAEKKADTPTEVENKYAAAFKSGDFATAASLCHGKQKEFVEAMGKGYANASEKEKQQFKEQMAGFSFSVKKEEIDGDYAKLTVDVNGKEDFEYLKKVGGEWKVINKEDYQK